MPVADEPVGAALGKIISALLQDVARQAATMREHALAAPDPGWPRPDPQLTSQLVEAIADRRQVRLDYRPRSGPARTTVVNPWAVVVRHSHWYLLCFAHGADAPRSFRVDRVTGLAILAATFTSPDDLDAVAVLERHLGADREFTTRVQFEASPAEIAPYVTPVMGDLEKL